MTVKQFKKILSLNIDNVEISDNDFQVVVEDSNGRHKVGFIAVDIGSKEVVLTLSEK